MATPITPKAGYAFKHKQTGDLVHTLFLGTSDSLDNYEEITEEEYDRIQAERIQAERARVMLY